MKKIIIGAFALACISTSALADLNGDNNLRRWVPGNSMQSVFSRIKKKINEAVETDADRFINPRQLR